MMPVDFIAYGVPSHKQPTGQNGSFEPKKACGVQ
jgi:hypothetical protein